MALSTEATELRFSGLPDTLLPQEPSQRLVVEAFHCRLKGPVLVDKKTLVELQGFQAVSEDTSQNTTYIFGDYIPRRQDTGVVPYWQEGPTDTPKQLLLDTCLHCALEILLLRVRASFC